MPHGGIDDDRYDMAVECGAAGQPKLVLIRPSTIANHAPISYLIWSFLIGFYSTTSKYNCPVTVANAYIDDDGYDMVVECDSAGFSNPCHHEAFFCIS